MKGSLLAVTLVLYSAFFVHISNQNSYRFVHEYANVTDFNPRYITIHKAYFHKYNRTDGAFNILFTTNKEIKNIVGYVESWAFKNNEFKRTAVDFKIPVCQIYKDLQKYNIGHLFENSNLSLSCPIKAATYYIYNLLPDASDYPPFLLAGRWKLRIIFREGSDLISAIVWVARIEY